MKKEEIEKAEKKYGGLPLFVIKFGKRPPQKEKIVSLNALKEHLSQKNSTVWYNFPIYEIEKRKTRYVKKKFELKINELMELAHKSLGKD